MQRISVNLTNDCDGNQFNYNNAHYHTHSKNIGKYGINPQSARRKLNYHSKRGKNCHKILSVQKKFLV